MPATLAPFGAELVFRGKHNCSFSGNIPGNDIVVIRFAGVVEVDNCYAPAAYRALIPLREQGAEVVLVSYEAT